MKRILGIFLSAAAMTPALFAQHYDMTRWGADRGYYDAPYFRYEAQKGLCAGFDGQYLDATDDQTFLQSEASDQQAITLGKEGYVEWTNDSGLADGVTLRFSLPWGTAAEVAILGGDGEELGRMRLTTDHSWEFCKKIQGRRDYKPEIYSRHAYNGSDFVRMRFDETHTRLSRGIAEGEKFRIMNLSDTPVTVDFLEIERTSPVEYRSEWVRWNRQINPDLQDFINRHQGQTIYIDEEYVGVRGKLNLGSASLQGRGMWHTELHWEGDGAGFNGFGGAVRDLYLSSYQNQRYDSPDYGPNGYGSPGKCFNGTAGTVERVWVEHFECGGWLSGANGARFSHCRFRNNYADGINFCSSSNCLMEHSSFRNNGDDDMASWSAQAYCSNNTFRYNTAEHNWRASSLGFFGGGGHKAHNILVKDGLESGVRLVSDFSGPAFGDEGIEFRDITIVHCACIDGEVGRHGDFWGVNEAALHIESSKFYPIRNPKFENIDILDSRGNALFIGSGEHELTGVQIRGLNIDGVADSESYAIYFENPRGSATLSDVSVANAGNLTNVNGGNLENSDFGGSFSLSADGIETGTPEPVDGCRLTLGGLSWEYPGQESGRGIHDGDPVVFRARIDNTSDVALPEGYPLQVTLAFDDSTSTNFTTLNGEIPAGGYRITECRWTATHGGHTATATLDPGDRYGEMTPAESGTVKKKLNVDIPDIGELIFGTTGGVDFQPLDLRWRTRDDAGNLHPSRPEDNAVTRTKYGKRVLLNQRSDDRRLLRSRSAPR